MGENPYQPPSETAAVSDKKQDDGPQRPFRVVALAAIHGGAGATAGVLWLVLALAAADSGGFLDATVAATSSYALFVIFSIGAGLGLWFGARLSWWLVAVFWMWLICESLFSRDLAPSLIPVALLFVLLTRKTMAYFGLERLNRGVAFAGFLVAGLLLVVLRRAVMGVAG